MSQVYLAGPITGLSFQGCTDWRNYAIERLSEFGVQGLSPMRAKEYLAQLETISGHGREYQHLGVFATSRGVMTRDFWDCTRCDIVLVNLLGAKAPSLGTVMEIAWAFQARIPVVCAIEKEGNPHEHMMIHEAIGFRVESLDEALNVALAMFAVGDGKKVQKLRKAFA